LESSGAWSSYVAHRRAAARDDDGGGGGVVEYLGDQLDPRHLAKKRRPKRRKNRSMSIDF
jgi:hypothetical protein